MQQLRSRKAIPSPSLLRGGLPRMSCSCCRSSTKANTLVVCCSPHVSLMKRSPLPITDCSSRLLIKQGWPHTLFGSPLISNGRANGSSRLARRSGGACDATCTTNPARPPPAPPSCSAPPPTSPNTRPTPPTTPSPNLHPPPPPHSHTP